MNTIVTPRCWLTHQERKLRRQQIAQDVNNVAAKHNVSLRTIRYACGAEAKRIAQEMTDIE